MTISAKLTTVNSALADIKSAIIGKGQTPTGNITTYATAIGNISGGGSGDDEYANYIQIENMKIVDSMIQNLDMDIAMTMLFSKLEGKQKKLSLQWMV